MWCGCVKYDSCDFYSGPLPLGNFDPLLLGVCWASVYTSNHGNMDITKAVQGMSQSNVKEVYNYILGYANFYSKCLSLLYSFAVL